MDGLHDVPGGDARGGGSRVVQATKEEQATIRAMLSKRAESAPAGAGVGRAPALAWAGLRLAAIVLLAAGVGIGLGDGDEFDDVGCSVAQQPGGTSHGARSAQARERAAGKLPGSEGGSAGGPGDGGPDGGKAETLKVEMLKAEAFPINLLKQVLDSTLEQQAAIERILGERCFADRQKGTPTTPKRVSANRPCSAGAFKAAIEGDPTSGSFSIRVSLANEVAQAAPLASPPSEPPRYALHRDGDLWHLTFNRGQAILKHERGICYVAEVLSHLREPLKKLNLAAKFSSPKAKARGSIEVYDPATGRYDTPASAEPVHEATLAADDNEVRKAYKERARELKDTLDDPTESEGAKQAASEELQAIIAHLSKDIRQFRDSTKEAGDAVGKAIKRLLDNLFEPAGSAASPHSVRRDFAEHLQRYLLIPSRRYAAPKARKARGDLTGCLLYDPPPGVFWTVSF